MQLWPLTQSGKGTNAKFRRSYGIPPAGDKNAPASEWGLPLPPAHHPHAVAFAKAVLRRAGQATRFDKVDVAKQVKKARAILAAHANERSTARESVRSWREIAWVNAARSARNGTALTVAKPRPSESLKEFFARVPAAVPAARLARLSESERRTIVSRAKARSVRLHEMATAVDRGLRSWTTSNIALLEAKSTNGVVENVLLLRAGPGNLADRHYYSTQCLQGAEDSRVFEGAQAYFDHPSRAEEQSRPERSVRHLCGWYSNVACREYNDPQLGKSTLGLFATFHPAVGNTEVLSIIRTCAEYAKQYPAKAYAGLSINALGDGTPSMIDGEEWNVVNEITAVESVDIVTKAGAGGAIIPLKEQYMPKHRTAAQKMREAKRLLREARRERDPLDLTLTLDADKVRAGAAKLFEGAKQSVKEALVEAAGGVQLTPEQDAALDKALGLVDGGALDQLIDQATGVADDDDADADDADDADADDADDAGAADDNDDQTIEGDVTEADIEKMSEKELKAALKKEREARKVAEKSATRESARAKTVTSQASRVVRERMADDVISELNIPESFVPRLKHEIIREGLSNAAAMRKHAQAFDHAFIRPVLEGAGAIASDRRATGAPRISFDFDGEN